MGRLTKQTPILTMPIITDNSHGYIHPVGILRLVIRMMGREMTFPSVPSIDAQPWSIREIRATMLLIRRDHPSSVSHLAMVPASNTCLEE